MRSFARRLFSSKKLREPSPSHTAQRKNKKGMMTSCIQANDCLGDDIPHELARTGTIVHHQNTIYRPIESSVGSENIEKPVKSIYADVGRLQQSTIIATPTSQDDKSASKNVLNTLAGGLEPLQRANSLSVSSRPCFKVQKVEKKSTNLRKQGGPTIGDETGVIARSFDDSIMPCTEQSKDNVSVEQTEIESSSDIGGIEIEEKYGVFDAIQPPIRDDHAAVKKLTSDELERVLTGHDRPTCATASNAPISSNLYETKLLENVEVNLDMITHPANEISMLAQSNDLELYVSKEDSGLLALQNRSFLNFVRDEDDLRAYNRWHWKASREQITLQEEFNRLHIEQEFGIHSIEGLVWPSPIEEKIRRALPWWKAQDLKRQLKVKERYRLQRLRPSFRASRAPQYGFYR